MRTNRSGGNPATYLNPVFDRPCADPFVLKHFNEYWCYSTGLQADGRCFGTFHSRDLVSWRELGGVMEPVDRNASCYWAPEVIYDNGMFIMYYSVGDGERMHIRAATADDPAGAFVDVGVRMTTEDFAIDPHVFRDEDGTWYLFYATDFLQHSHIGTGTVCDVMLDRFTLKGEPRIVTRARFDWQVFDPRRKEKGGVRWHTVEGPFVLKRKGTYYQMFSGGNWKNQSYGVSYAVTRTITTNQEWDQIADGERVLPILRTIPGKVIGPGHNSAIRGPDNLQSFCIYHRWASDLSDRLLSIDRLDWAGERMFVIGATTAPQPAPNPATFADFFDEDYDEGLGEGWRIVTGKWRVKAGKALQHATEGAAEVRCLTEGSHFIVEVSVRFLEVAGGACGIKLIAADNAALVFQLLPAEHRGSVILPTDHNSAEHAFALPDDFNMEVYHLLRVEVGGAQVRVALDERPVKWEYKPDVQWESVALFTSYASAAFRGFALTRGWQDLFMEAQSSPGLLGWKANDEDGRWRVAENQLWHSGSDKLDSVITKEALAGAYELVVNAKIFGDITADGCFGFLPALEGQSGPLLSVVRIGEGWILRCERSASNSDFYLPDDFDPFVYNQFRFRKQNEQLLVQYESQVIGAIVVPKTAKRVGLYASGLVVAFDMVRVTAL